MWSIGLMTGTVLDGNVDVAALRTDGEQVQELGPWMLIPYPPELRPLLLRAMTAARQWQFAAADPPVFREAELALTLAQAEAVVEFRRRTGISANDTTLVGFHGQTVLHRAPTSGRTGATRQLGDGELMARILEADVVYDFRSADMRAGGQGAPLAASYHLALLKRSGSPPNSAVLNLGGVANVTWWGGGDQLIAFDTGPANAPLNDWVVRHGLGEMDRNGALAGAGRVDEARLQRLLEHPHFAAPFPKSLDRNTFSLEAIEGLRPADGAATLTAFIGAAVGRGLDRLPQRPDSLIVCGGGRKNPAILESIRSRAGVTPVLAEDVGWRGDAIEAECFAYLAVRSAMNLPFSFPKTTGVPVAASGGRIARWSTLRRSSQ
jgi:anhydro-N-acetylmuramic acid kinase